MRLVVKVTKTALLGALFTVCAVRAAVVPEDGFSALNIIPYSPGREDVAAQDAKEYVSRTGNDIVLYCLTLHRQGKPAMHAVDAAVASYRAFVGHLKGTAVRPGILLQAILGHWPRTDREIEPWQRTVPICGGRVRFCPLDPNYQAYIREVGEKLAACGPCLILSDDDIRAFSPLAECFCPLHTAAFNQRIERNLTPDEYRACISDCEKDSPEHRLFAELQREMVLTVCRKLREGIDAVDPRIEGGICLSAWMWEVLRSKDCARAMAAKGQVPFLRLPNGRYSESTPKWDLPGDVLKTQTYQNLLGRDVLLLDESDTWPHNLWSKSAAAMHAKLAASAFLGLNGAKLWFVNAHKGDYPVNRAYTDVLAAHRGYYAAIAGAVKAADACGGVAIPTHAGFPFTHVKDRRPILPTDADNWASQVFGAFGIPFHLSKTPDEPSIYALAGESAVSRFTDDELRQLLSRRILIDLKAASALTKRGFAELMGATFSDRRSVCTDERDEVTGDSITYPSTSSFGRLEAAKDARILSSLVWRPYADAPTFDRVSPAAVLHTNALGGTVMTVAYHLGMGSPYVHSEARKDWLVRRLADLNGGKPPDGIVCDDHNALALTRGTADVELFFFSNLGFDPVESVSLSVARKPQHVEELCPDGSWRERTGWTWQAGVVKMDISLPCYAVGIVRIAFGQVASTGWPEPSGKRDSRQIVTFCNPIDIAYRMQPDQNFREGADPEIVLHGGRYWLFASKCGGYYVSDDLVSWQLVKAEDLPLEEWAPTVAEIGGKLHFSARGGSVFRAIDAAKGKWERLDVTGIQSCDSALFLDDDGKLYNYWGAGPKKESLLAQQLNPVSFRPVGRRVVTLELDLARYGWDVRGKNNEATSSGGYPEGSQMVKRDGRYYFQYATPGTEYPSYCDVALIGTNPLGPFVRQRLNPFSSKPDGYARGSGHGKTFCDKVGNWWHVTTCVLGGINRRISLMPVFFDADGEMWCDTAFADWPLVVPDRRAESPEAYHAGWMPLAYGKPARVSSGTSKGTTDVLTDEDIGTFWSASSKTTNEFAEVSFGGVADVRSVQIGFADQPVAVWRRPGVRRGYRVEATSDGKSWRLLFAGEEADREQTYCALATPVKATAIRVVPTELPEGASFALREIRAFGRMEKPLPEPPQNVKVVRDKADRRHARVTWEAAPGATGYLVKFGPSAKKQHLARLVRGKTELDLRMLDAQTEYVWSVVAFNEAGFAE